MFNFIKKLFGLKKPEALQTAPAPYKIETPVADTSTVDTGDAAKVKPVRTRTKQGKFIGDNPATPKNEAWSDGKSQAKPRRSRNPSTKKTSKKPNNTTK